MRTFLPHNRKSVNPYVIFDLSRPAPISELAPSNCAPEFCRSKTLLPFRLRGSNEVQSRPAFAGSVVKTAKAEEKITFEIAVDLVRITLASADAPYKTLSSPLSRRLDAVLERFALLSAFQPVLEST